MSNKKRKNANGEGTIYQCKTGKHKGKWIGQLTIGINPETGKQKRKTFYGGTRREVKEQMEQFKQELGKGVDVHKQSTLYADWLVDWMKNYKKNEVRLSTWENYAGIVDNHIIPALGHYKMSELTPDPIQELYNSLTEAGLASATVRRVHHIINGSLEQAIKNKIMSWNPNQATSPPKVEKEVKRPMTNDEMDKFLAVLEDDQWGTAFLMLLGTGLRRGELLALRWDVDVDITKGIVIPNRSLSYTKEKGLYFSEPKTKSSKKPVPLSSFLCEELLKHYNRQQLIKKATPDFQDQGLVFCTRTGGPIFPRHLNRKFYALREKAGISEDVTLHGLRKTFATRLLEAGENLKTIQELLRHADIKTTGNIYAFALPEVKQEAVDKIDLERHQKVPGNVTENPVAVR